MTNYKSFRGQVFVGPFDNFTVFVGSNSMGMIATSLFYQRIKIL